MRTFIAIDFEEEIKKKLYFLLLELDKVSQNIKWVKKEGMHLTLKFLGEIEEEKIPKIEAVLNAISKMCSPFPLRLKGTGTFPPGKKNPRVIWIGIEGGQTLKELQAQLEEELEKLDFPREKREFHPHLTLGRVKIQSHLGGVLSQLEREKETTFGEMKVNKITFFQSILKPTGAEYKVLSEFELK